MNSRQIQTEAQKPEANRVELCKDLLSRSQKLPCFAENMSAQTQTYIDLVRARGALTKTRLPGPNRVMKNSSRSNYVPNQTKPATGNPG
jgi:hypothetical protein